MPSLLRLIARLAGKEVAGKEVAGKGLVGKTPPDKAPMGPGATADDARAPYPRPHPGIPRPNPPVCIIGDVHGMADLLETLLARIAAQPCNAPPRLIFTGDLIDRGAQSAAVVARVRGLCVQDAAHHICLMGNHERMLLDALADPDFPAPQISAFERWLSVGGAETCESFGVSAQVYSRAHKTGLSRQDLSLRTAQTLRATMGADLLNWLQALPLYWQEADLVVAHAGADPALPMADQDPDALLWGPAPKARAKRAALPENPAQAGQRWVVQGHVIVPQVDLSGTGLSALRHIGIDTGAYRTGRLCALWLDHDGARVIEVTAK